MKSKHILITMIAIWSLAIVSFSEKAKAQDAEVKGMVTARSSDTMIVKSGEGHVIVLLTDDTNTKDDTGVFGLQTDPLSDAVLVPGLKVHIAGSHDEQGRIVAHTITVDGDDLETAEMIQAGLHPTADQVAANIKSIAANKQNIESHGVELAAQKESIASNRQDIEQNIKNIEENTQRFMALTDYDVKDQTTVRFAVGSSEIASKYQDQLKVLAQRATGTSGYIVEVTGYADSTGNAAMNTKLSEDRAKAVVSYLFRDCNVPMRHIVAPGAMGEYGPAAPNETKTGRAENRRVDVKILVNKGVSGS
jgi:OmpA-OmpF porin, OOP family